MGAPSSAQISRISCEAPAEVCEPITHPGLKEGVFSLCFPRATSAVLDKTDPGAFLSTRGEPSEGLQEAFTEQNTWKVFLSSGNVQMSYSADIVLAVGNRCGCL